MKGTLRKVGSSNLPWEARWWEDGRQRKRRFRTEKAGHKALLDANIRDERRRLGMPADPGPITYAELVQRYLDQYDRRSKRWLEEMLSYSLAAFGDIRVRSLASDRIALWLTRLPVGSKTKRHALNAARQVLAMGVEWGYLAVNPARPRAVNGPAYDPPTITPFTSHDEVLAVAAAAGRYGPAIVYAVNTGERPEEWIAHEKPDIKDDVQACVIDKTFTKGTLTKLGKTDGSLRTISLSALAMQAADEARSNSRAELLFPAEMGGYINLGNWRKRVWYPALQRAGVAPRPPSQMRHSFATLGLAAGAPIEWISKHMGHSDIRTTLRYYARFLPETDTRNVDILDDYATRTISRRVTDVSQTSITGLPRSDRDDVEMA